MAKRTMSEEQKAKMKAGRDAAKARKLAEQSQAPVNDPKPDSFPNRKVEVDAEVIETLMKKVAELEKMKNPNMTPETALADTAISKGYDINIGGNGVQGRIFKYPVEKSFYPDPTERLYDEKLLSRYNLRENFVFDWDVEGVEYEKYNVTYAEPRFTVRLFRKLFEDDGLTPSGKVALVNRAIMHEDEVVARHAADKLGLTNTFESHQDMLNEMRYYRFRQWLLDLFTPPKVEQHNRQATQMVIDGKVVEVFDTEVLIEKSAAESKSAEVQRQVRI